MARKTVEELAKEIRVISVNPPNKEQAKKIIQSISEAINKKYGKEAM